MSKDDTIDRIVSLLSTVKTLNEKVPGLEKTMHENISIRFSLNEETDRGCALLAVSFLEQSIEKCLSKKLIGSKNHKKLLFDFNGPLGNFSNKLSLSYSIGIITKMEYEQLQQIRKVRNTFAHSFEHITFETKEIKDKILNFKLNPKRSSKTSRKIFISTVFYLLGTFQGLEIKEKEFIPLRKDGDKDIEKLRDFVEKQGY
ncbi:MltR family transcriptional regulator [uncultured Tenacibaculum sp.]|uniref:MltR family transcriptional regulator n=1 Tax=uncultured Tenacibaculum sp. TaxID=174713 RepID=UPI00262952CC|nr:MltR family transcriptional regulator [uncultured Tenacibaculum sp.]